MHISSRGNTVIVETGDITEDMRKRNDKIWIAEHKVHFGREPSQFAGI